MNNRIVFIVATQYDNIGDLLINKALINELSKYGEVFLDTKNVPQPFIDNLLLDTKSVYELKSITKYSFKGLGFLNLFLSRHKFSHIFKSPGPFGATNLRGFLKNLLFGIIFLAFRLKSVKSYLIGNDIHCKGKLDLLTILLYEKLFVKSILCRSYTNLQDLRKIGLKNVGYIPDMCFGYQPIINNSNEKNIAISFRRIDDIEYHDKIVSSIDKLISQALEYKVSFFFQVDRDKEYNLELFEIFKNNYNVEFIEEVLEWGNINIYNKFSFTLSNRLHVLLLGLVHNVIPVAVLNKDIKLEKIINIFEAVGLSQLIFDELTEQTCSSILENQFETSEIVNTIKLTQRNMFVKQIENLFSNND